MANNEDIDVAQAADAEVIAKLVDAYIAKYGCGETAGCETCDIGVAIDLKHLDAAYNAGYNKAKAELTK